MIRTCHLSTVHHRYDTRIFVKECRTLAKNGYEVSLVVADGKGDEMKDGVRFRDIGRPKSRLFRILFFRKRVLSKALELNADLYHFHDPELLGVGLVLARRGKKVVYDSHEDVPRQLLTKEYIPGFLKKQISSLFEKYENKVIRQLSGIAAATPFIRDRFLVLNPNVVEVQNFPFLEEFETSERKADSAKENKVCYVGTISKVRGIHNIIKAFQYVDDAKLLLGGNFESEQLREECIKLREWDKVDELGFLDRDQVISTMHKSVAGLVVLQPTINYLDSIPVKMFEYMAAGIPVIASDFSYWRELLSGADCAIFVDPDSPSDIASGIRKLMADKKMAHRMGRKGRRAVENRYNWGAEEKKLLGLYRQVLGVNPS
jgi:glycosyltransferase involved in cell wall biosynthesis